MCKFEINSKGRFSDAFGCSRYPWMLYCLLLCMLGSSVRVFAEHSRAFAVDFYKKAGTGVTAKTSQGLMRIEACTDRIIHILITSEQSLPKQPPITVPNAWSPIPYSLKTDSKQLLITMGAFKVRVARDSGAVSFLSLTGKPVLQEAGEASSVFTPNVETGIKAWQMEQTSLSPKDEALCGLGQYQAGWFNLCGIPFRLRQANTNISIPVVLSTKGYSLIWNNASVTDFNLVDQPIGINQKLGLGSFHTIVAGDYGFLLGSDRTIQLRLEIDRKPAIGLVNMWVRHTAGGHLHLQVDDRTVPALGKEKGVTLPLRPPADLTTFRSRAGASVDYYFIYGSDSRYRLMSSIYPVTWNLTSQRGTMMRALPLEYPKAVKVHAISDQFLFRPTLLINPVTELGVAARAVYLPVRSARFDFWTGKKSKKGQTIRANALIDYIPIVGMSGSIIVLGPVVDSIRNKENKTDIRAYPREESHFLIYDAEGNSYRYEKGSYASISLNWNDRTHMLSVGNRQSSFPGIASVQTLHLFLVREGEGMGIRSQSKLEAGMHYKNLAQLISFRKKCRMTLHSVGPINFKS
jgi:alpha-glucosidase (family GH31 glycosyl hydrolase)